jgi:hypothetical protein
MATVAVLLTAAVAVRNWPSRPADAIPNDPPWVVGADREVDLGVLEAGHGTERVLRLHNPTAEDVRLSGVRVGCGCLHLQLVAPGGRQPIEGEVIPPGGSVEIAAGLSTVGMSGRVRQAAYFMADTGSGAKEFKLVVTALVEPPAVCDPESVDLGSVPAGAEQPVTVRVTSTRGGAVRVTSTSPHLSVTGVDPDPESPGTTLVRGRLTVPFGEREVTGQLVVTDDRGREVCTARVRAVCEQVATLSPSAVVLPCPDRDSPYQSVLRLTSPVPCRLRVAAVPPGVRASVSGETVTVEASPTDRVTRLSVVVEAVCDSRSRPISIPVTVFPESVVPHPGGNP